MEEDVNKYKNFIIDYKKHWYLSHLERLQTQDPIFRGCKNKACYCTGDCKIVIGYKPKEK